MPSSESKHGGARRNAGRPKMKLQDKRAIINFTISPATLKEFRKAVPSGRRARFVEEAILLKLELDRGL
jgi:hypothetical protein